MPSQQIRAAMLLTALAIPFAAGAVTVDGDLSDLIVASGSVDHGATASESGADAENNGFDITNMYLYFDVGTDTLYGGFETQGPVGNACVPTGGGACFIPANNNVIFESTETIGMSLDIGTLTWAANDARILLQGDGGAGTGPDVNVGSILPAGVTSSWAVNEAANGIEFSFGNLIGSGAMAYFSVSNPVDIAVRFNAGSGINPGPEDAALISTTLVPVPAAVWLFGSGLMGLAALRRKQRVN